MAILIHKGGEIEVWIKKYPLDGDEFFDEYVKTGERQPKDDPQSRYINVEANAAYAIEIVLKKGFNFEDYSGICVSLQHAGSEVCWQYWERQDDLGDETKLRSDQVCTFEAKDATCLGEPYEPAVDGKTIKKARFSFDALEIGGIHYF